MTIEKIHNGAYQICGVVEREGDHYFLTRTYYGYTKRQAIQLWREEIRESA